MGSDKSIKLGVLKKTYNNLTLSPLIQILQKIYKNVTNREEEPTTLGSETYAKIYLIGG